MYQYRKIPTRARLAMPVVGLALASASLLGLLFLMLSQMGNVNGGAPVAVVVLGQVLAVGQIVGSLLHLLGVFGAWPIEVWKRKDTRVSALYGLLLASLIGFLVLYFGYYGQLSVETIVSQREYVTSLRNGLRFLAATYVILCLWLTYIFVKSPNRKQ